MLTTGASGWRVLELQVTSRTYLTFETMSMQNASGLKGTWRRGFAWRGWREGKRALGVEGGFP